MIIRGCEPVVEIERSDPSDLSSRARLRDSRIAGERKTLTPSIHLWWVHHQLQLWWLDSKGAGKVGSLGTGGREEATLAILCELLSLSSLSLSLSSAAAAFYDFPVQHRVSRGSTTPQHSYITGNFEIVEREFREAVAVRARV